MRSRLIPAARLLYSTTFHIATRLEKTMPRPKDEQGDRIRENLAEADPSTMSIRDLEAIFEDRDIAEFL